MDFSSNRRVESQISYLTAILLFALIGIKSASCGSATEDFFPYDQGEDIQFLGGDDDYVSYNLREPFTFFDKRFHTIYISPNGFVSFEQGSTANTPSCTSSSIPMIMPFWADVLWTEDKINSKILYRESKDQTLLNKLNRDVLRAYPTLGEISLSWMFLVTYKDVPFYKASSCSDPNALSKRNTFQLILASSRRYSFALFYYAKILWTTGTMSGGSCQGLGGSPAMAGYDYGDGKRFYAIPGSCTSSIINTVWNGNAIYQWNQWGKWILSLDSNLKRDLEELRRKESLRRQHLIDMERKRQQQDVLIVEKNNWWSQNRRDYGHRSAGSCLLAGTKILMADGTMKNIQDIKADDLILDINLQPTRVTGINYQFLMDLKLYGFDNFTQFFTEEHMFVGPPNNTEGSNTEYQLYVRSIARLLETNPLMKFWDIKGMQDNRTSKIFRYDETSNSVQVKSVRTFLFEKKLSPETRVYFLNNDSPSGTYFANGYVCKVDIPSLEKWPNTMSLLFNVTSSPAYKILSKKKYSIPTVIFVEALFSKLVDAIDEYINTLESNGICTNAGTGNATRMILSEAEIAESLHNIFNEPTSALLSLKLYAALGDTLSHLLDEVDISLQVQGETIGKIQHDLYQIISSELTIHANK